MKMWSRTSYEVTLSAGDLADILRLQAGAAEGAKPISPRAVPHRLVVNVRGRAEVYELDPDGKSAVLTIMLAEPLR